MTTQLANKRPLDTVADKELSTSLSQPSNGDAERLTKVGLFNTRLHNIPPKSAPVLMSST